MITNLRLQCFCIIHLIVIKTEWVPINFLAWKWLYLDNSFSKEKVFVHGNNITIHFILFKYHWVFSYSDIIMNVMVSQITSVSIVYSTICSGADQRKHQSSMSLAFVRGIHRWPVNSPHKWPVTREMFPFDDVIMYIVTFYFCTRK